LYIIRTWGDLREMNERRMREFQEIERSWF
jgi:hypothetical protein